tara:strand:- start:20 stop:610 length:591 start_codon:yes stop_codon:yes gene_type:complete
MNRTNYHFGNLKETILNEALKQLKNNGLNELSFRLIAKNIGVAPSAPYNHFDSKDHLLQEIIFKGQKSLMEKMKINKYKSESPSQQLAFVGKAYLNFSIENKELFNLMFSEKNKELIMLTDKIVLLFKEIISNKFKEGKRFRVTEKGASITAWSMIHGLSSIVNKMNKDKFEKKIEKNLTEIFIEMSAIWGKGVTN